MLMALMIESSSQFVTTEAGGHEGQSARPQLWTCVFLAIGWQSRVALALITMLSPELGPPLRPTRSTIVVTECVCV